MDDAVSTAVYAQAYDAWRADPSAWWARLAEGITWDRRWDRVVRSRRSARTAAGSPAPR